MMFSVPSNIHLISTKWDFFWGKKHFHSDFQEKQFISPLLLEKDIFPLKQTEKGKFVAQITQKEETCIDSKS